MLVLARRIEEEILLDIPASAEATRVSIKVCDVRGASRETQRVSLGIEAPPQVEISRLDMKKGAQWR